MSRSIHAEPTFPSASQLARLASVFDRVRDPRDWMGPIDSEIPASERPLVEQAVLLFTSTEPTFAATDGAPDRLVVRAPGYRRGSRAMTLNPVSG